MAQVRLGRLEAEEGLLPPVCLRCGQPATGYQRRTYSWHPSWVHILHVATVWPLALAALLTRKRLQVCAPYCDEHRATARRRRLVLISGLGGFGAMLIAIWLNEGGFGSLLDSPLYVSYFLSLLWLARLGILRINMIRPKEITDDSITLTGVSPTFVSQHRAERRSVA